MEKLIKIPKEVNTWNLHKIKTNKVETKIPSKISDLINENTILIVNGELQLNNSLLMEIDKELTPKIQNELCEYDKKISFKVSKNIKETINIINYINTATSIKVGIEVDKFSKVKINELIIGDTSKVNLNLVVELNDSSEMEYTNISVLDSENIYQKIDIESKKDSKVDLTIGYLNQGNTLLNVNGETTGQGAVIKSNLVGITTNNDKQHAIINLVNNSRNTETYINNYVVSNKNSKLIIDGIGKINKGMSSSKAFQNTKGLILTKDAECHTNPFLLIDEYDVEAGHGATVGRIDDEHLYYLMSRGLTELQASNLIIKGYVNYLYSSISDERIIKLVEEIITNKLK